MWHECRLIIDPPAPGAWNMAVDEALLLDAAENGLATLRFYQWSEPTLSLGYFQRVRRSRATRRQPPTAPSCAGKRAAARSCTIASSPTAWLCPPVIRSRGRHRSLYTAVHDAFIAIARTFGIATMAGDLTLLRLTESPSSHAREEPFLCFQRRAPGDVLLIDQPDRTERRAVHGT